MIVRLPPAFLRAFFCFAVAAPAWLYAIFGLQIGRFAVKHFAKRGEQSLIPPPPILPQRNTYVRWLVLPLLCLNRVFFLSFVRLSRFLRWIYGPRRRCQKCFRTSPPLPPFSRKKIRGLTIVKAAFFLGCGNHCTLGDCVNCVSTSSPIPPLSIEAGRGFAEHIKNRKKSRLPACGKARVVFFSGY